MNMLRTDFFDEGKQHDATPDDDEGNCWLCKQEIDYDVPAGTTDDSHNLDHYFAVADYPELQEDPENFRHAHQLCNNKRSNNAPSVGLGEAVPDWW
ncbi:hypothetical protein E3O55_08435 [Cryobacterium sp. MDB1-18-2]|nr:hypothetical protein E3O55_08435 [Cryobacterium sp. MDB1-18-2]TFC41700.1 hypothetical protein E3O50_09875 [Cryobacterium sp. MDB1-18-1]